MKTSPDMSYCMNVHPANSYGELIENLKQYAIPVREKVADCVDMGVELHLNHVVGREVESRLNEFSNWMDSHELKVFSINNYPLIDFHQSVVKDKVYLPNWLDEERLEATLRSCRILATLLPPAGIGNVSTLGGAYRFHQLPENAEEKMAEKLINAAAEIIKLNESTGKQIGLAMEPEPDTTLDSRKSILDFFEEVLPKAALKFGISMNDVKQVIGINLDACHSCVIFENPSETWTAIRKSGIEIFKLHVTNAPRLLNPFDDDKIEILRKLDEPKYLHQSFAATMDGKIHRYQDLNEMPLEKLEEFKEIRTHFHVPLHLTGFGSALTTNEEVVELLTTVKKSEEFPKCVVETYTWPQHISASGESPPSLVDGISEEVRWLADTWKNHSAS